MPDITEPSIWRRSCVFWCLDKTAIAFRRLVIAWIISFSSSRNLAASVSRILVASSNICVFSTTSALVFLMEAVSTPKRALRLSISELSCSTLASASATALVFSFSDVSHQHTILSYISASLLASASSSAFIFMRRFTTRFTGLTYFLTRVEGAATGSGSSPSNSAPQTASNACCRAVAEADTEADMATEEESARDPVAKAAAAMMNFAIDPWEVCTGRGGLQSGLRRAV
mmetsp:Transcript_5458/g.13556  ORF Transcript_5458/g.13556 Transcript_5458/m.13556 type:complete len:230 (+) Transcript_5458:1430-2119(+)